MQRKQLSKKDIKDLNAIIKDKYNLDDFISKKASAELIDNIIIIDKEPSFFYYEEQLIPTLKLILKNNFLKKAVVDMPAVPFVVKGADIMRPGIKEMDNFNKGNIIAIVDENNKKPLSICIAEFSSDEIKNMDKGKVLKNIHHIGDDVWKC
jgi:PUA domain protein